jgi:glycosyltransferase involved in cell wall biosynthesis
MSVSPSGTPAGKRSTGAKRSHRPASPNHSTPPTLSVVVPMYNEEEVIGLFTDRLRPVLDGLGVRYEVLCVDDGSRDRTAELLEIARAAWPQLRIVRLRRNCGHQAALTAGLDRATGAYVATIDADLQDPPEVIATMLERARRDAVDVVYGVRVDRSSDSHGKRWTAGLYYRLMRRLAGNQVPDQAGDFRLLSRAAVDALRSLPEQHRVYRLLIPWLGFPSASVSYARAERAAGTTKYPLTRMVRLAFDSITNFSAAPLRIATWLGVLGFAVSLVLLAGAVVAFLGGWTVPGWASLLVAVGFLGAIQLLCLGMLGEYVGRLFTAVQGRPTYFIASDTRDGSGPGRTSADVDRELSSLQS